MNSNLIVCVFRLLVYSSQKWQDKTRYKVITLVRRMAGHYSVDQVSNRDT